MDLQGGVSGGWASQERVKMSSMRPTLALVTGDRSTEVYDDRCRGAKQRGE